MQLDLLVAIYENETLRLLFAFAIAALSAREIGRIFGRYNLPHITGYLLAGVIVGPFVLGFISEETPEGLRFIDELSLAVIAFVAGTELYFRELRSRIRPILFNVAGIVIAVPLIGGIVIFFLEDYIPFTQDFPTPTRIAVAILGATILLAISPASTIAVINEVRARGAFTKTVLSITVIMDVTVVALFAVSSAVAGALLHGEGLNPGFILLVVVDIVLGVMIGLIVGQVLWLILRAKLPRLMKIALILITGYSVFEISHRFPTLSQNLIGVELRVEPLLEAMVASLYITNFTPFRKEFAEILEQVTPFVYVAFFTLTGIALKLDILVTTGFIALVLWAVRVVGIGVGTFLGNTAAGEPPRFRRLMFLALITQAGISLGLAREAAVEFPELGDAFATMIISVVVINELSGPLFLKSVLRRIGEANEPDAAQPDVQRDAVVLGVEAQSLALARELHQHNWKVILADTDASHVERLEVVGVDERHIPEVNVETLSSLMSPATDAMVAMLKDDAANLRACEIAYENFGIKRIVVRLNDVSLTDQFAALGAIVVDPATAMVNLLDQTVRAPQTAALMLHQDPEYDIVQITVTDPDFHGMLLRDLRLPTDVLILEISRDGHSVVPHGYTPLHLNDDLVLIGKPASLQQVTRKMGF